MFEQLGFETLNPVQASLILALILGALFGAIAQHLKFCFRSAVVGMGNQAQSARGLWLVALGTAVLVTQLLTVTGYISFDGHRLLDNDLPSWMQVDNFQVEFRLRILLSPELFSFPIMCLVHPAGYDSYP